MNKCKLCKTRIKSIVDKNECSSCNYYISIVETLINLPAFEGKNFPNKISRKYWKPILQETLNKANEN